jgi:hypothetical protein
LKAVSCGGVKVVNGAPEKPVPPRGPGSLADDGRGENALVLVLVESLGDKASMVSRTLFAVLTAPEVLAVASVADCGV